MQLVRETVAGVASVLTSREGLRTFLRTALYRNALYLIAANFLNSLLGFVFWIIVARIYTPEEVGLGSAAISAVMLLSNLAGLGLGLALIRFLPRSGEDGRKLINSTFSVGAVTSIIAGAVFIAGLSLWSPSLVFLRQNSLLLATFIAFVVISTLSTQAEQAFVAKRRAGFILTKNLIFNVLRLPLPFVMLGWSPAFGVFGSWGIAIAASVLISIFFFLPRAEPGYRPALVLNKGVLAGVMGFSLANYISLLLWSATVYVMPLLVVNRLGGAANAHFYTAFALASILFIIPSLTSTALFAEGSHDQAGLRLHVWRSLRLVLAVLLPAVLLVAVFARYLLLVYGQAYSAEATTLLRILAVSALPMAVNVIYLAVKRVQMKLGAVIGLTALIAAVTLGGSHFLLPKMGVNGAGAAWLAGQGAAALWVITSLTGRRRERSVAG